MPCHRYCSRATPHCPECMEKFLYNGWRSADRWWRTSFHAPWEALHSPGTEKTVGSLQQCPLHPSVPGTRGCGNRHRHPATQVSSFPCGTALPHPAYPPHRHQWCRRPAWPPPCRAFSPARSQQPLLHRRQSSFVCRWWGTQHNRWKSTFSILIGGSSRRSIWKSWIQRGHHSCTELFSRQSACGSAAAPSRCRTTGYRIHLVLPLPPRSGFCFQP